MESLIKSVAMRQDSAEAFLSEPRALPNVDSHLKSEFVKLNVLGTLLSLRYSRKHTSQISVGLDFPVCFSQHLTQKPRDELHGPRMRESSTIHTVFV